MRPPVSSPHSGGWRLFYRGRGPPSTAHELSERLLASATSADDRALRLQAHHASWATAFARGEFEAALFHAAAGLSLYEADSDDARRRPRPTAVTMPGCAAAAASLRAHS